MLRLAVTATRRLPFPGSMPIQSLAVPFRGFKRRHSKRRPRSPSEIFQRKPELDQLHQQALEQKPQPEGWMWIDHENVFLGKPNAELKELAVQLWKDTQRFPIKLATRMPPLIEAVDPSDEEDVAVLKKAFERVRDADTKSNRSGTTLVLSKVMDIGLHDLVLEMVLKRVKYGLFPWHDTYVDLIDAFTENGAYAKARFAFEDLPMQALRPDRATLDAILESLQKESTPEAWEYAQRYVAHDRVYFEERKRVPMLTEMYEPYLSLAREFASPETVAEIESERDRVQAVLEKTPEDERIDLIEDGRYKLTKSAREKFEAETQTE